MQLPIFVNLLLSYCQVRIPKFLKNFHLILYSTLYSSLTLSFLVYSECAHASLYALET